MLKQDVLYGKIIETPIPTQPFEMLPGFPVPIPGIVFLTAGLIFPATFDSDILKIVYKYLLVIPHEGFQGAGFCKAQVFPLCCSLFWRWQWHFFDNVPVDLRLPGY